MRRVFAVGAAAALLVAITPAPGHGSDAVASTGRDTTAGRGSVAVVHGDVFPPDADHQLATAQMSSFAPPDGRIAARRVAGAWCGSERSSDDAAHAAAGYEHVIKVVYASPSDYPDRFSTFSDLIQSDARTVSDVIQSAAEGTRALRFDMGTSCGVDYVDIASVRLHPRDYYVHDGSNRLLGMSERSSRIRADVARAMGPMDGVHDLLIYADGLYTGDQVSGLGEYVDDDRDSADNVHNGGDLSAIILGSSSASTTNPGFSPSASRASSVLHELGHALGAVQLSAPHSTGQDHCNDGADVLCYADGGPRGHPQDIVSRCAATDPLPFDCGADDYFAAHPAPGSYLATHWNLYDSQFLCAPADCVAGSGRRAPTASIALRDASGAMIDAAPSGTPVVLDGSGSSDPDGSVVSWAWDIGADGSVDATTPRMTWTFPGAGSVPVRLRVTDNANLPDATTRSIVVNSGAAVTPTGGADGRSITLAADDAALTGSVDVVEDPRSVVRRRLRQARMSAEKRLRKLGVDGLLQGKSLTIRYRSPQDGELTASLNIKDLPVVVETRYARTDVVTAIRLRVAKGSRGVLRRRTSGDLKLQLDFRPVPGAGRRPR